MRRRGERMQAEVPAVLCRRHSPLFACDVLGKFCETNSRIAPTTIYRALSALKECGRVHHLKLLNAYIACRCDRHRFAPKRHVIEVHDMWGIFGTGEMPA